MEKEQKKNTTNTIDTKTLKDTNLRSKEKKL
jgi:hypothetical protein